VTGLPGDSSPLPVAIKVRRGRACGWDRHMEGRADARAFVVLPPKALKAQECSAFPPQTLPELCSHQDELDFLMEALIIRCSPGQAGGCGGRQDLPTGMASLLFMAEGQPFRAQRFFAL
jgi:hypothetical protein